jgi:2-polyprenyl-3-methyl-5-hydroxy-6-metoxy-1,4-benzoquinol methylase
MQAVENEATVQEFLTSTSFTGYQAVPLPHGLRVPGEDLTPAVDLILDDRVRGKSVLDVGTYYGLFPCEAIRRGAREAVGIEPDPSRYQVAKRISELYGGAYEVLQGTAEELELDRTFDVVLFLNVLHHVLDPIAAIQSLARNCSDTMIIEFCLTSDPEIVRHLYGNGSRRSLARRFRARLQYWTLQAAGRGLPLMAVANRPGKRTFYFSREAFHNLFVTHLRLFSEIEFHPSARTPKRVVAICKLAQTGVTD